MEVTAKFLAQYLGGTIEGDENAKATRFAKIEHAKPGSLCFFANPKYEEYVYTNQASLMLVDKTFQPKKPVTPTMIRVENAYTAVSQLLKWASDQRKRYRRHRSLRSIWHPFSSHYGKKVYIGPFTNIGKKVSVGDYTIIHSNVTIGEGTTIGKNCIIYPGARIYPGMVIGDRVIIHSGAVIGADGFGNAPQPDGTWQKIEHLGNVIIGNDVEIGANATIDRAQMESTIIQDGAKIDNLCMIAHNVVVGKNTVMAAQCGIAGSTELGENCILAGQVGIVGHVKVAPHTTLLAQCGLIGNVKKEGEYLVGMPAIPRSTFLKAYAKFKKSGEE